MKDKFQSSIVVIGKGSEPVIENDKQAKRNQPKGNLKPKSLFSVTG